MTPGSPSLSARLQLIDKSRVLGSGQTAPERTQHLPPFVAKHGVRVEPQARENARLKNAIVRKRDLAIFSALTDEPEHLSHSQSQHHILAHAGFFVVSLLAVEINRFGGRADLHNKFWGAMEVIFVVHPHLAATFRRNKQAHVGLRLTERPQDLCTI